MGVPSPGFDGCGHCKLSMFTDIFSHANQMVGIPADWMLLWKTDRATDMPTTHSSHNQNLKSKKIMGRVQGIIGYIQASAMHMVLSIPGNPVNAYNFTPFL